MQLIAFSLRQRGIRPPGPFFVEVAAMAEHDQLEDLAEKIKAGAHAPVAGEHFTLALSVRAGQAIPRLVVAQGVRRIDGHKTFVRAAGERAGL